MNWLTPDDLASRLGSPGSTLCAKQSSAFSERLGIRLVMQVIDAILREVDEVAGAYHRLLLLVGRAADMSRCLAGMASRLNRPVLNLNAELASALLEIPHRQRQLKVHKIIGDIIDRAGDGVVLFDHTDILFSPALRLDALALLKSASRNKTVVAAWPGVVKDGKVRHAEEWHPEHQCHSVEDIKVVAVSESSDG